MCVETEDEESEEETEDKDVGGLGVKIVDIEDEISDLGPENLRGLFRCLNFPVTKGGSSSRMQYIDGLWSVGLMTVTFKESSLPLY